jgi:hypothetical protein
MAETVGQHSVAAFTSPVNGTTPIDANSVRGNDNTMRSAYVDHDADPGIHVQSSTLASRPVAGTAGRKWITVSSGRYQFWYDDGSRWHEVASDAVNVDCLADANLAKGDVIKITGFNNGQNLPTVNKVTSSTDVAFGLVENTVTSGNLVQIVNTGLIEDVDTNGYAVGTILYPNTSGGWTTTKPTSGNYQPAGFVLRGNTNNGVLYVEFSAPRIVERSNNEASTIVLRDASGNFAAGTITAGAVTSTGLVTFASLKGTGATTVTNILDEDNMASDSATALATQQSIKAYVDAKVATVDTLAEVLANGNTTGATDIIVTAGQKITTDTIAETTAAAGVTIDSVLLKDNAVTATTFNGTLNGAAPAGSLSGTTLASNVVSSSLTSVGTLANLTVTNPITGSVTGSSGSTTGNAATATALQTARNINGVSFNGTADITVTAAAGTLTGTTLASGVTASSLTSVGTLSSLTVSGDLTVDSANNTFKVDSTNNRVGVGTASPSFALDALSSGDTQVARFRTGGSSTADIVAFERNDSAVRAAINYNGSDGGVTLLTTTNHLLAFGTNNTRKMTLDTSGNLAVDTNTLYVDAANNRVGVGTASPGTTLHATATGGTFSSPLGNVIARFNATTNTAGQGAGIALTALATKETAWVIAAEHTSGNNGDLTFYGYQGGATYAELMRMSNAGNLGLGVTPSAWDTLTALQVKNAAVVGYLNRAYLQANAYFQNAVGNRYIAADFATRYTQDSGKHIWETAPSGSVGGTISFTQAMTLDASGNLGVGTTSPARQLSISNATQSNIQLTTTGAGSAITDGFQLQFDGSNNYVWGYENVPTLFGTNNTERARITSGGYFKASSNGTYVSSTGLYHELRSADNAAGLVVTNTSTSYTDDVIYGNVTTAAGTGFKLMRLDANSVEQFRVRGDGTIFAQNTTVQSLSDVRLKENISDAAEGLAVITALRPVRYDWKAGYGNDRKNQLGFVAQEMEAVFPEAVSVWEMDEPTGEVDEDGKPITEKVDYKTVGPGALIPVLVKAIQELEARIATLEAGA